MNLKINNFKCFYDISIPINKLTVFAGANGNGKSTAIQALLFLRRTIEHCGKWESNNYDYTETNGLNVELNGAYCLGLGNSSIVLPKNSDNNVIGIGIVKDDKHIIVQYEAEDSKLWLTPINVMAHDFKNSSLAFQEFYYLNAERIGPRISQSIKFHDYPNAGFQGEYVAQLIADTERNYRLEIAENRRHPDRKSPRLEQQVNAWLNEIMPGVSIFAIYDSNTNSAQIQVDNFFTNGNPTLATNIGFGISYALPIIVTGLIARTNSFMIIENPEAHLHPSAQSAMGKFLAMIANAGVKVIVETHSDHIINGLQIAAAKNIINHEQITINYFSQPLSQKSESKTKDEQLQPLIENITINNKGELSHWPKGFFDQSQIDFGELFKIRKG